MRHDTGGLEIAAKQCSICRLNRPRAEVRAPPFVLVVVVIVVDIVVVVVVPPPPPPPAD